MDFDRAISGGQQLITMRREVDGQTMEQKARDVYDSHRHRVFAIAFYMTGNELEAEKILAQTFIEAFQECQQPQRSQIDRELIDQVRQRFPIRAIEPAARPSAENYSGGRNLHRSDLEEALQFLPAAERLVFLLVFVEGYSQEDVAQLTGLSISEVRQLALSARIRVRQVAASLGPCTAAA